MIFLGAKCEAAVTRARQTFEKRLRPSTSSTLFREFNKGDFPSGQRGQTVNLLAKPSVVRIHHLPPNKRDLLRQVFFVWWNEAFPYWNIKQPLAMKTLTLMKCAYGTIRNALLHQFAKRICIMAAKQTLYQNSK